MSSLALSASFYAAPPDGLPNSLVEEAPNNGVIPDDERLPPLIGDSPASFASTSHHRRWLPERRDPNRTPDR